MHIFKELFYFNLDPALFSRTHVVEKTAGYIKVDCRERPTALIAIDWLNTIFFQTW